MKQTTITLFALSVMASGSAFAATSETDYTYGNNVKVTTTVGCINGNTMWVNHEVIQNGSSWNGGSDANIAIKTNGAVNGYVNTADLHDSNGAPTGGVNIYKLKSYDPIYNVSYIWSVTESHPTNLNPECAIPK